MSAILQPRTQWTDFMGYILKVATIYQIYKEKNSESKGIKNYFSFPFRLCDITLPQDNSIFVYILISLRSKDVIYTD